MYFYLIKILSIFNQTTFALNLPIKINFLNVLTIQAFILQKESIHSYFILTLF